MSDDLERQLQAFGQTLEATVGEPMRSESAGRAGSGSGRRWAVLGAAACLTAVVAGLLLLNGDGGQVATEPPPAPPESTSAMAPGATTPASVAPPGTFTDQQVPLATVVDEGTAEDLIMVEPTAREPIPPGDALAVTQWGWALQQRSTVGAFGGFEPTNCGEWIEQAALGGVPVKTDTYTRRGDELDWLAVIYVDYGTAEVAERRLGAMRDPVDFCESWGQPVGELEPIDVTTGSGRRAIGWQVGELKEYAMTGSDGLTLVIQGGFLSADDWNDVISGADSYLASDPQRGAVIGADAEVESPGERFPDLTDQSAGPTRAGPKMEGKRVKSSDFTESVPANVLDMPSQDWQFDLRSSESHWYLQEMLTAPGCDVTAFEPLFDSYYVSEFYTNDSLGMSLDMQVFDLPDGVDGATIASAYRDLDRCQYLSRDSDPIDGLSPSPTPNVPDATGAVFDTQIFDGGGPIETRFADISVPGPGARFVSLRVLGIPPENLTPDLVDDLVARAQRYLFGDDYVSEAADPDGVNDLPTAVSGMFDDGTVITLREPTADDLARVADDDTSGLSCDAFGVGGSTWDYGPIGPGDPTGRQPSDAFFEAWVDIDETATGNGGRALPTEGWTELRVDATRSVFVLEQDGVWRARIDVGGVPDTGVWRHNEAMLCQSLFMPG